MRSSLAQSFSFAFLRTSLVSPCFATISRYFRFSALSRLEMIVALTAFAVFAGHCFPVFFQFRGGKGAAIGAAAGGGGGLVRGRRGRRAAETGFEQAAEEFKTAFQGWDRNWVACMQGRKYSIA